MNRHSASQFDRWNDEVVAICGRFHTRPSELVDLFFGEIHRRMLGTLEIADIRTNASSITRARSSGTSGDDRFCFLVMQRSGTVQIRSAVGDFALAAGEMALLDSARDFEMRPHGLLHQVSIHLPRDLFERAEIRSMQSFGKLSRTSLNGQILREMVLRIAALDTVDEVATTDGESLQEALGALSRSALIGDAGEPLAADASLRKRAEQLIACSLQDDGLSPVQLASQLGVSVRCLYRAFEPTGESIGRYVRRRRLEASSMDLSREELRDWTVTAIAHKWGFQDSAHFSRLFKQHFGVAPKDFRERNVRN